MNGWVALRRGFGDEGYFALACGHLKPVGSFAELTAAFIACKMHNYARSFCHTCGVIQIITKLIPAHATQPEVRR